MRLVDTLFYLGPGVYSIIELISVLFSSRSGDLPGLKKSSSFHAYGFEDNEDKTEDVEFVVPDSTANIEEPHTTRVHFKEEIKEDKTKTAEDGKTTQTDMDAEFAGIGVTPFSIAEHQPRGEIPTK